MKVGHDVHDDRDLDGPTTLLGCRMMPRSPAFGTVVTGAYRASPHRRTDGTTDRSDVSCDAETREMSTLWRSMLENIGRATMTNTSPLRRLDPLGIPPTSVLATAAWVGLLVAPGSSWGCAAPVSSDHS